MEQTLGQISEGTLVKIEENGSPVQFYVAKQNYEPSLNGTGRVLLVRKDVYVEQAWHSSNVNAYADSDLDDWFNNTYKNMLDSGIRSRLGSTRFYYTPGNDNNTVTTLARAVFALSLTELGYENTNANEEGTALTIASTLRGNTYLNGELTTQWTRSPDTLSTTYAWRIGSGGGFAKYKCTYDFGARPCFTLPAYLDVSNDGTVYQNTAPNTPASITVPESVNKGGSVAISWAISSDANGNLSGYTLQRSVNGNEFVQVYQGGTSSYTDTVPVSAGILQYRVQAYDAAGAVSGWRTSDAIPVDGVLSIIVPPMVMQGQSATISWSALDGADSYTLQRKSSADTDWTQVYSGANLSYTETVGTWTSLQYRVQGVFDGTGGGWATSDSIQIVSASALVISGSDGDLGTLTSDVQYSVSSDQTGNTISVSVEVNGGEYAEFTATSGQTYSVGVLDLPTGTGNITITATTTVSSSPVTVTRSWTYSKTAQTFPNSGSVATLTQEGNVVYPETLVEAVRASMTPWGGNLSTALDLLSRAALYNRTQTPKYNKVTISLSGKTEGQIIQLPENGKMVEFYVAKLDYESALNGAGRVLLVRKDCYDERAWDAGNVNAWANSDLDAWFNGTYKNLLDPSIQAAIGTTKFYYTPGNGNNTVGTLERAVFALSATELGHSAGWFNVEGSALPIANTLKVAYLNGSANTQWTRSPGTLGPNIAIYLNSYGRVVNNNCDYSFGSRPAFTLPPTFTYGPVYVDQAGGIHDQQEYTPAGDWLDVWGNAIPAVKIETGSYTGTGTYGSSNPNTLTFGGEPQFVSISGKGAGANSGHAIFQKDVLVSNFSPIPPVGSTANNSGGISASWVNNQLSFYSSDPTKQLNFSGSEYGFFAITLPGGDTQ